MKPNTGLHKKVACIFDGTQAVSQPAASQPTADSPQPDAGQVQPPPSTYGPQPIPVPAARTTAARPSAKTTQKGKNKPQTKQGKTDPKQLKMLILVGVLSVMLVAVLFFVLSSPSAAPKKASAANTAGSAQTDNPATEPVAWKRPEPWPDQMRDPMTLSARTTEPSETAPTDCIVKGIVFSQTRPSAIIGEKIVCVGDTINGITITAINKSSVEFEKDGKRWTQEVQR